MKVLLVAPVVTPVPPLGYGGIEFLISDYGRELAKSPGVEVTLAAPKYSHIPGCQDISTVNLNEPYNQWREDKAYKVYRDRIKDFDVVHDLSHKKVAGRLNSNIPQISVLWHAFSYGQGNYPEPKYNLLAVSKWHAECMKEQYKQEVKYVTWGVDTEFYKPTGQPVGDYYLFIGHPAPTKGMHEAISMCLKTGQKLKIIGGQVPNDTAGVQYRDRAIAMCDGKQIIWLGEVSNARKRDELAGAKALFFPVQQVEGGSLTIEESLACGTPVLTSTLGAYPELVPSEVGVCCKSEPEYERILATPRWTDGYDRGKIREYAVREYSMQRVVNQYLALYVEVAAGARW